MKQLKMTTLAIALSTAAASSVMAQTSPAQAWSGFSADIKAGYASFIPSIGSGTVKNANAFSSGGFNIPAGYTYATTSASANTLNTATAAVEAAYNFAVTEDKLLGLGLTYYTGATGGASGTLSPTSTLSGSPFPAVNITYQVKNLWAVSLTPGFAIDKERLVYAKIGYTGVTLGASGSSTAALMPYGGSSVPYQTVNLSGYNLGLGYKQIITGSLYWLGEANYGSFSNKLATVNLTNSIAGASSATMNFGGSGFNFLAGIGYRF